MDRVTVFEEGGVWRIVRNLRQIFSNGINGTLSGSSRSRMIYECWDGKEWCHQRHFGLKFSSRSEAEEYLTAYSDALNGVPDVY